MRANLAILRNFFEYKPDHLVIFGGNISTNLDLVTFPNLPVPATVIKTLADDLSAKQGAMITGGPMEREARDNLDVGTVVCPPAPGPGVARRGGAAGPGKRLASKPDHFPVPQQSPRGFVVHRGRGRRARRAPDPSRRRSLRSRQHGLASDSGPWRDRGAKPGGMDGNPGAFDLALADACAIGRAASGHLGAEEPPDRGTDPGGDCDHAGTGDGWRCPSPASGSTGGRPSMHCWWSPWPRRRRGFPPQAIGRKARLGWISVVVALARPRVNLRFGLGPAKPGRCP